MAKRAMLVGVNRELRTMPDAVQRSATAVLAQELAREYDAGRLASAGQLLRALAQLRQLAAPPKIAAVAADVEDEVPADELDELARARAARLAEAAGVVRTIGADDRRAGGRQAR